MTSKVPENHSEAGLETWGPTRTRDTVPSPSARDMPSTRGHDRTPGFPHVLVGLDFKTLRTYDSSESVSRALAADTSP